MIYFDTCALMRLVRQDYRTDALMRFIDAHPDARWFASELAKTEIARAVRRANHNDRGQLRSAERMAAELEHAESLCEHLDLVPISSRVLSDAAALQHPFLRTLDAIHLATAAAIRTGITAFVTYDKRLAAAAGEEGLPVVAPGVA